MGNDWYDHDRNEHRDRREWLSGKPPKPYNDRLPEPEPSLWKDFDRYLSLRNLSPGIARANLWYPSRSAGDDAPRIVIPATSSVSANKFWQARVMGGALGFSPVRYQSPHGCRSGDAIIVVWPGNPGSIGYRASTVVEGPMDALAAAEAGIIGVALMGASPPPERIDLTVKLVRGTICYVVIDSDQPAALVAVMSQLSNLGVQCRLRDPSPAKDLADLSLSRRKQLLSD